MTDEYKERLVKLFGQHGLEWMLANQPEHIHLKDTLTVGHSERIVRVDVTVPCGPVKLGVGNSPLAQRMRLGATIGVDFLNAVLEGEMVGQPTSPQLTLLVAKIVKALDTYRKNAPATQPKEDPNGRQQQT